VLRYRRTGGQEHLFAGACPLASAPLKAKLPSAASSGGTGELDYAPHRPWCTEPLLMDTSVFEMPPPGYITAGCRSPS